MGATFWWAAAPSTGKTAHTEEGLHTLNANVMQSVETLKLKWRLSLQNKNPQINWLIIENLLQVAIIITLIKHIINHFIAHIKKNSMWQVVFWLLVLPLGWHQWFLWIVNRHMVRQMYELKINNVNVSFNGHLPFDSYNNFYPPMTLNCISSEENRWMEGLKSFWKHIERVYIRSKNIKRFPGLLGSLALCNVSSQAASLV